MEETMLDEIRKLPRYGPEYEHDTGLQMVQYAGAECIYLSDVEKLFAAREPQPSGAGEGLEARQVKSREALEQSLERWRRFAKQTKVDVLRQIYTEIADEVEAALGVEALAALTK